MINKGQVAWFGLAWLPVVCEKCSSVDEQPNCDWPVVFLSSMSTITTLGIKRMINREYLEKNLKQL